MEAQAQILGLSRPALSGVRFDLADCINPQMLLSATGVRFDAGETAVFLRQLTDIYTQTYDVQYVEGKARKLIPVDGRVSPGAESYLWRQFDKRGQAKVVHNYADDFPNVEIFGKEFQHRVVSLGCSYQYSMQDLRAASMAGLPLESRKAEAARFAMDRLIEHLAAVGMDGANGADLLQANDTIPQYGLCNFPGIGALTTTVDWTAAATTVQQILSDLNRLQKKIFDDTTGIYTGDTLLLPTVVYSKLATTARSPTFTEDSMLQYILKQSPWLKSIEHWAFLDTAGKLQDGTTAGPRIMLYKRDPQVLGMVIPQEFEQLPPQLLGMTFKVPCHQRWGGVKVHYPKALCSLDGTAG